MCEYQRQIGVVVVAQLILHEYCIVRCNKVRFCLCFFVYLSIIIHIIYIMCFCLCVYLCIIIHWREERREKKMHGSCIQQTSHQFDVLSAHREQNLYCWHWTEIHGLAGVFVFLCLYSLQTELKVHYKETHTIPQKVHSSIRSTWVWRPSKENICIFLWVKFKPTFTLACSF